uniref:UV excision repair protein RAD23 n=1 Tax=Saccharomyces cerevisiae (strain ATCC 204508 / S288c) TaxID=559292 RepID=UPI00080A7FAC|nr:Chain A, UV excision repair protein RAD23 [Saccharomyces cerevisiae S288C]
MVSLTFKNFKKEKVPLDLEPSNTILETKTKLAQSISCEESQIKLIYSGKVLQDSKTVSECGLKDGDQVVFMVSQKKSTDPNSSSVDKLAAALEHHHHHH